MKAIQQWITFLVMGMFLVSVPGAFAIEQQDDESRFLDTKNIAIEKAKGTPKAIAVDGKLMPMKMKAQKLDRPILVYEEGKKLDKEIETMRKEHNMQEYMEELKKEGNFNNGKALLMSQYAYKIAQRLHSKMDGMMSNMKSNEAFMQKHPDALPTMQELLAKLQEIETTLKGVIADNTVSREEWTQTIVPALKDLRGIINDLRIKHQGFFNDWRQNKTKETVEKIIEKLKEKRETMKLHLLNKGIPEEEVMKRLQEIDANIAELQDAAGMEGPGSVDAGAPMMPDMAPERKEMATMPMKVKEHKIDAMKIKEHLHDIKEALEAQDKEDKK